MLTLQRHGCQDQSVLLIWMTQHSVPCTSKVTYWGGHLNVQVTSIYGVTVILPLTSSRVSGPPICFDPLIFVSLAHMAILDCHAS